MGPEIFDSNRKLGFKRKLSPEKSRSYSCSTVSPSCGIKVKIRRVETRRELVDSVDRLRRRLAVKMSTKACFMVGCELVFSGDSEADAKAKVMDHIIRTHEQNGAEERRVYLATQQAQIASGYMDKLREAKDLNFLNGSKINLLSHGKQNLKLILTKF